MNKSYCKDTSFIKSQTRFNILIQHVKKVTTSLCSQLPYNHLHTAVASVLIFNNILLKEQVFLGFNSVKTFEYFQLKTGRSLPRFKYLRSLLK